MMTNFYLSRYAYPQQHIKENPSPDLGLVVTIPCFNEPNLIRSLDSLHKCLKPVKGVEIILVINQSEKDSTEVNQQNEKSFDEAKVWADKTSTDQFKTHVIYVNDLPTKHAGVGLARKIAMDEAVRRFESIGNLDGIIACFDADSTCDNNYLVELEQHFKLHDKTPGCSIYFEHPLDQENQEPIIYYELFLRYYVHGLRYAGFPHAYQTVGSSMAVRSWAYQKQGGMNRRKGGEDFYFLHRIIPLGNYTELNTTRVLPSPRKSDRVPFGTGRSMLDWGKGKKDLSKFYSPQIFEDLKLLIDKAGELYSNDSIAGLPESIVGFLNEIAFDEAYKRIRQQSKTPDQFRKHFFQWFDGFKVLKYVHYARDNYYPQVGINKVNQWLGEQHNQRFPVTPREFLLQLRHLDQVK